MLVFTRPVERRREGRRRGEGEGVEWRRGSMRSSRYRLLHKRTHCNAGHLLFAQLTLITRGGLIFHLFYIPIWLTKIKGMPNTKRLIEFRMLCF